MPEPNKWKKGEKRLKKHNKWKKGVKQKHGSEKKILTAREQAKQAKIEQEKIQNKINKLYVEWIKTEIAFYKSMQEFLRSEVYDELINPESHSIVKAVLTHASDASKVVLDACGIDFAEIEAEIKKDLIEKEIRQASTEIKVTPEQVEKLTQFISEDTLKKYIESMKPATLLNSIQVSSQYNMKSKKSYNLCDLLDIYSLIEKGNKLKHASFFNTLIKPLQRQGKIELFLRDISKSDGLLKYIPAENTNSGKLCKLAQAFITQTNKSIDGNEDSKKIESLLKDKENERYRDLIEKLYTLSKVKLELSFLKTLSENNSELKEVLNKRQKKREKKDKKLTQEIMHLYNSKLGFKRTHIDSLLSDIELFRSINSKPLIQESSSKTGPNVEQQKISTTETPKPMIWQAAKPKTPRIQDPAPKRKPSFTPQDRRGGG